MNKKTLKFVNCIQNVDKWYNIVKDEEIPEVFIYDAIGSDLWEDGVSPKAFVEDIRNLEKDYKEINLRINSPGGYVYDSFSIYNHLVQSSLKINVYIDGLAASCASFIAMSGDNIYMAEASEIMIHDPWSFAIGDSREFRKEADHLDTIKEKIVNIYKNKTGLSEEKLNEMMKTETWINAADAKKMGFATEVLEDSKIAACLFDLNIFDNIPDKFKKLQNALQKRQKEKALRDAGHSKNDAKKELSDSYRQERDALMKSEASKCFVGKVENIITNLGA
jgi:ATP-dependent Clp protease protease subunit